MNARAPHFPLFDSVRALAVLAVITIHALIYGGGAAPHAAARPFLERLDVAATVFFLVSGFLLYRPFVAARIRGEPPPRTVAYAGRRLLRIVPGYWVALTVTALVLHLPGVLSRDGFFTYYLFGQIYRSSTTAGGIPQAWTLCVEIAFYAFVPLWALLVRRVPAASPRQGVRRELAALGLLALASVIYKLVIFATAAVGHYAPALTPWLTALPGYLDHLALGMGLAVLSVWWGTGAARNDGTGGRLPRILRPLDRFPGLAWLLALGLLTFGAEASGLVDHAAGGYTHAQYFGRHALNAAIALAFLLPAVFGDQRRGAVRGFLGSRAFLWIGLTSYGFYLYHSLVLAKLSDWAFGSVHVVHPYVDWEVAAVAGTAVLAALSYYLLERPALNLKGRLRGGPAVEVARPADSPAGTAEPGPFAPPRASGSG